jgi:tetratricopeptide (TPR) repeat protein
MPDSFQKQFSRAKALIEIARYREAIVELSALAASEPRNYQVLCSLSLCHYQIDEPRRSLEFARDAAAANPGGEWAFRLISLSYSAIGLGDKALEAAKECIKRAPYEPYALQTLAYAQINYSLFDDALETADLLLKTAPDKAETHDVLGYLAMHRENYAEAERHFLSALEIDAESAVTHNNLGAVYLNQSTQRFGYASYPGRGRKARDHFLAALKIRPTFVQARENLENAENNANFFGGKGTRFFIKIQAVFFFTTILARVVNGYIPDLVNRVTPYEPYIFTICINIIFVVFLAIGVVGTLTMRGNRVKFLVENFKGKPLKSIASFTFNFLLQVGYAFFIVFIDSDMSGATWLLLIPGAGLLVGAFRIFAYYDAKVEEE